MRKLLSLLLPEITLCIQQVNLQNVFENERVGDLMPVGAVGRTHLVSSNWQATYTGGHVSSTGSRVEAEQARDPNGDNLSRAVGDRFEALDGQSMSQEGFQAFKNNNGVLSVKTTPPNDEARVTEARVGNFEGDGTYLAKQVAIGLKSK